MQLWAESILVGVCVLAVFAVIHIISMFVFGTEQTMINNVILFIIVFVSAFVTHIIASASGISCSRR